jgi:hypothetical protein
MRVCSTGVPEIRHSWIGRRRHSLTVGMLEDQSDADDGGARHCVSVPVKVPQVVLFHQDKTLSSAVPPRRDIYSPAACWILFVRPCIQYQ